MARYEHLPIFRAAFDLALHLEKIVQNFSRYHKYTLGTEQRNRSRAVLELIIAANTASDGRQDRLLALRAELEQLKVLVPLCHQSGGFATTCAYLDVSEQVVGDAAPARGGYCSGASYSLIVFFKGTLNHGRDESNAQTRPPRIPRHTRRCHAGDRCRPWHGRRHRQQCQVCLVRERRLAQLQGHGR